MKRKTERRRIPHFLLLGFFVFCFVFGQRVSAQENKAITVATVNIYNPAIISQDGANAKLKFTLSNRQNAQPGVRYAVKLSQQENGYENIVDQKIYDETLSLNENENIEKIIEYQAPGYLKGTYQLSIMAQNEAGMLLSFFPAGNIELNGNGQYVEIVPSSCSMKIENEKPEKIYSPYQGVDISKTEKLIATCAVENHFSREIAVSPRFATYLRNISGQMVDDKKETVSLISLKANEKKTISFALPQVEKPQAYDAKLYLAERDVIVSNAATFHFVLQGLSSTIQNVRLDKDFYQKGDQLNMSFFWTLSADNFPGSRMANGENLSAINAFIEIRNDKGEKCIEDINKPLENAQATLDLKASVLNVCQDPNMIVILKDKDGNILDQKKFAITSKPKETQAIGNQSQSEAQSNKGQKTLLALLGLIVMILIVMISIFAVKKGRVFLVSC